MLRSKLRYRPPVPDMTTEELCLQQVYWRCRVSCISLFLCTGSSLSMHEARSRCCTLACQQRWPAAGLPVNGNGTATCATVHSKAEPCTLPCYTALTPTPACHLGSRRRREPRRPPGSGSPTRRRPAACSKQCRACPRGVPGRRRSRTLPRCAPASARAPTTTMPRCPPSEMLHPFDMRRGDCTPDTLSRSHHKAPVHPCSPLAQASVGDAAGLD